MDLYDDNAPVFTPDYDPGVGSGDEFFDTESSSNYTMSTLSTGEAAEYFHLVHGFYYSNDENLPWIYPIRPSSGQLGAAFHSIVRLSQDGTNIPPEAEQVIQAGGVDGSGVGARVLDLPTNCGTWVQEMTSTYPTASFVSIDVKPLIPHTPRAKVSFEVYDLYAGISEPSSSFDVVHARQCVTTTKNFNFLLREMHRVLKPNGVLVITEIPIQGYEVLQPSVLLQSAPRQAAGVRLFRKALEFQGIDISAWDDLSARLGPGHALWTERAVDPVAGICEPFNTYQNSRGFCQINLRTKLVPSGPWHEDETQRMIGSLARFLFSNTWDAFLPLLLMMGMEKVEAQEVVDGILKELADDSFRVHLKCHRWSAKKIAN